MSKDSKFGQQAKILTFHPTGEYYFTKGLKAYHRRELPLAQVVIDLSNRPHLELRLILRDIRLYFDRI